MDVSAFARQRLMTNPVLMTKPVQVTFVPDPVSESENMTPSTISMPSMFSSTMSSSSSCSHLPRLVYSSSMGVVPARFHCNCFAMLVQTLLLSFTIVCDCSVYRALVYVSMHDAYAFLHNTIQNKATASCSVQLGYCPCC